MKRECILNTLYQKIPGRTCKPKNRIFPLPQFVFAVFLLAFWFYGCGFHLDYVYKYKTEPSYITPKKTCIWPVQAPENYLMYRPNFPRVFQQDLQFSLHQAGFAIGQVKLPTELVTQRSIDVKNPFHWFFKNKTLTNEKTKFKFNLESIDYIICPVVTRFRMGFRQEQDWISVDMDIIDAKGRVLLTSIRLEGFYTSIMDKISQALTDKRSGLL